MHGNRAVVHMSTLMLHVVVHLQIVATSDRVAVLSIHWRVRARMARASLPSTFGSVFSFWCVKEICRLFTVVVKLRITEANAKTQRIVSFSNGFFVYSNRDQQPQQRTSEPEVVHARRR